MAVCLATFKEFPFQVVHLVDEFLTHGFAQGVAFASGEVGKQSRQQHDLLLVDRHPVGVFQIFLHFGNIVDDGCFAMFSGDEVGYIIHRPGTVKGVHGNQVFKSGWLQFAEIFLHTRRLELEGADSAPFAIEFICERVVDRDFLHIDVDAAC